MSSIVHSVMGDCHLGLAKRNKWLYEKSHQAFHKMIDGTKGHGLSIAGDLWDTDSPKPYDLVFAQEETANRYTTITVIPGNHDRVMVDGTCAAHVLNDAIVYTEPIAIYSNGGIVWHYVPYTADVIDSLRNHTANYKHFDDGNKHILISHFALNEVHSLAGLISEDDPVFEPYYQVIVADIHVCYDHGKFHTTGATYFCNVDEMYSPKSIPSYVNIMSDGSVERVTFPEWKPQIIGSEVEAVDDDQLYLIVSKSNEAVPITKPNVFVKQMGRGISGNGDDEANLEIDESISLGSGVDKNKFFAMVYPDMSKVDLQKLRDYESGLIEIEDLIAEGEIKKVDDGKNDDAILNGLVEDGFSF